MALDAKTILTTVVAVEFAADTRVDDALALAAIRIGDPECLGSTYNLATAYLAAHILASTGGTGVLPAGVSPAGAITSLKTGALSLGFAGSAGAAGGSNSDAALKTTRYGLEYLALRDESDCTMPEWIR